MKLTLLTSLLALFLGSAVQAAPAPQLGNALGGALSGITAGLPLVGGGGAGGGAGAGLDSADFDDETTR